MRLVGVGIRRRGTRVHRDAGTDDEHGGGSVEDGVAGEDARHRYDHEARREEPGTYPPTGVHTLRPGSARVDMYSTIMKTLYFHPKTRETNLPVIIFFCRYF